MAATGDPPSLLGSVGGGGGYALLEICRWRRKHELAPNMSMKSTQGEDKGKKIDVEISPLLHLKIQLSQNGERKATPLTI